MLRSVFLLLTYLLPLNRLFSHLQLPKGNSHFFPTSLLVKDRNAFHE